MLSQRAQGGGHSPQPRLHLPVHPLAGDEGAGDADPAGDEQAVTGLPGRASPSLRTRFPPPSAGFGGDLGDLQDDEGGEGQAGQQAAAAAAQRAPVGADAAPAPPPAPAVAEAHPGHRHGHGEEQSHRGTDDIAQLVLHHLRHRRASSAPLHRARAAPCAQVPHARWITSPPHPPPHVPAHLRRPHRAGVIQGCPEQLCKKKSWHWSQPMHPQPSRGSGTGTEAESSS